MMSAYNRMPVVALRDECASRGLLSEGLDKRDIIIVLRQFDDADDRPTYMLAEKVELEMGGSLQGRSRGSTPATTTSYPAGNAERSHSVWTLQLQLEIVKAQTELTDMEIERRRAMERDDDESDFFLMVEQERERQRKEFYRGKPILSGHAIGRLVRNKLVREREQREKQRAKEMERLKYLIGLLNRQLLAEKVKAVDECVDVQNKLPSRDNENKNLEIGFVLQQQRQDSNHDGENIRDCNYDNSCAAQSVGNDDNGTRNMIRTAAASKPVTDRDSSDCDKPQHLTLNRDSLQCPGSDTEWALNDTNGRDSTTSNDHDVGGPYRKTVQRQDDEFTTGHRATVTTGYDKALKRQTEQDETINLVQTRSKDQQ